MFDDLSLIQHLMDDIEENVEEEEVPVETGNSHEVKQETDGHLAAESGEKKWPGWPGESVFRILIPAHKVGSLIGRKGEFIKRMCEESRARIKILEGPPGVPERAVLSADLRQQMKLSL